MPRSLNYRTLQDRPKEIWGRGEISRDVLYLDEAEALAPQFRSRLPVGESSNDTSLSQAFCWLSRNITRGTFLWIDPMPPLTRHVQLYIERANDIELFQLKAGHLFTRAPGATFEAVAKLKSRAACIKVYDWHVMQQWLRGNSREDPAPFPREREVRRYSF